MRSGRFAEPEANLQPEEHEAHERLDQPGELAEDNKTRRTRFGTLESILMEVNQYTRGWMAYFRLATTPSVYQEVDE